MGQKNPKLILEGADFRYERKSGSVTFWVCSFYFRTKCRCRLKTTGNTVYVNNDHNHNAVEIPVDNMRSKNVFIIRSMQKPRKKVINSI